MPSAGPRRSSRRWRSGPARGSPTSAPARACSRCTSRVRSRRTARSSRPTSTARCSSLLAPRLQAAGLADVVERRVVEADTPGTRQADGQYDAILLAEVDHYFPIRSTWLKTAATALKPGGRIVISNRIYHRAQAMASAQKAGLVLETESTPVPTHFIAVFVVAGVEVRRILLLLAADRVSELGRRQRARAVARARRTRDRGRSWSRRSQNRFEHPAWGPVALKKLNTR